MWFYKCFKYPLIGVDIKEYCKPFYFVVAFIVTNLENNNKLDKLNSLMCLYSCVVYFNRMVMTSLLPLDLMWKPPQLSPPARFLVFILWLLVYLSWTSSTSLSGFKTINVLYVADLFFFFDNPGQLFWLWWYQGPHPSLLATVSFNFLYVNNLLTTAGPVPENSVWLRRGPTGEDIKTKSRDMSCVAGTTVYMTPGTDSHSWMPTMMEHRYPWQHRTLPRTPPGTNTPKDTNFCIHVATPITYRCINVMFYFVSQVDI